MYYCSNVREHLHKCQVCSKLVCQHSILGPNSAATAVGHCWAGEISQPHTQVKKGNNHIKMEFLANLANIVFL